MNEALRDAPHRDTRIREIKAHILETPIKGVFAYSQAWYTKRSAS